MEKYVPVSITYLPDKQLGNRSLAFLCACLPKYLAYLRYISPRYRRTARIGDAAVALAVKTLTSNTKGPKQALLSTRFDTATTTTTTKRDMFAVCLFLVVGMEYDRLNRKKPSGGELVSGSQPRSFAVPLPRMRLPQNEDAFRESRMLP